MLQISIREGKIADLIDTLESFAHIWYAPLQNHVMAVIEENHKLNNEKINNYFTAIVGSF
jgi:hypothetical protein